MSYIGTVENGVVILPEEAQLSEGTKVKVEPVEDAEDRQRWADELLEIARSIKGLPEDFAENHNHYIHGTPKR